MSPVTLNVPFHDKDVAKRLGVRWNPEEKTWFVADGVDTDPFRQWLPQPPKINVRSACYFVAQSRRCCWKCERETNVFGVVLPSGHAALTEMSEGTEIADDAEYEQWRSRPESVVWVPQDSASILHYITYISETEKVRIESLASRYRMDFSKTTGTSYWMNHCESCGMKQGDFEVVEEFDAPLRPVNLDHARQILLHQFLEPFEASASMIAYEAGVFEHMRSK